VLVGTLELTEVIPEEGVLVFDPTSIIDGIELSDDPVLRFRAAAYTVSIDQRLT
jgi:catalase